MKTAPARPPKSRGTRGFWPMRDLPMVGWLAAAVLVALAHPLVPAPRWLLIHLALLGAATHSILVWSRFFADALLHTPTGPSERAPQNRRLVLLNTGTLLVVLGVSMARWYLTLVGGTAVVLAVVWHGGSLVIRLRAALAPRFRVTVHYYVAAATLLALGGSLGVVLARVQGEPWHERLLVSHASVNLLGWIGLSAVGTLITLWPTMLRTKMGEGADRSAARVLPLFLLGVVLGGAGPLLDLRLVTAAGYLVYLVGLLRLVPSFLAAARTRSPQTYPTYAAAAAAAWLIGCLAALVLAVGLAGSWGQVDARFGWFAPFLAAGFATQLLLGASSYLVPVALGGGPGPVRAANVVLDRGAALRVTAANAALVVCLLPVPAAVRVLAATVVLVALAAFLPLLVIALRASRKVRNGLREAPPIPPAGSIRAEPAHGRRGLALGLAVVLVAALIGLGLDRFDSQAFTDTPVGAGVVPTGHTTTVKVTARDMRFHPAVVSLPAGDRLVIDLTNTDRSDVHDLVLDDGDGSGRLSPGESARLDAGVIGRDVAGWCSVVGHRQMGMTFAIRVTGAPKAAGTRVPSTQPATSATSPPIDLMGAPGPDFSMRDPELPRLLPGRVHRRTFHIREVKREVAPGVIQQLWTYGGTVPGPTLHGRIGDRFEITLVNDAHMGHSIDFHAGSRAPDRVMRTIPPGGRLVYRFTATHAGIWMYHCSTMPMSAHIANGLFGAVVIDPPGLRRVDHSYLLAQSELYLGPQGGSVDFDKIRAERPDLVVFNGYADQYDHRPIPARVGERIRIWLLDAGPDRSTSFHVVGAQFDTTYAEGQWLLRGGADQPGAAQSLGLQPAQGGFVELRFTEPGHYAFITHAMVDAERGAHGTFVVTGPRS